MTKYIGIDLGTTNSAICIYDGEKTTIVKGKGQTDVTPSAIYFDKRGNKFIGLDAYKTIPRDAENVAILFKRFMGSNTPITIPNLGGSLTPEECSAEILKELFGLLPEEIRKDPEIGTVITVPAAFNQMQKDATLKAANMAGIGKVVMLQEPVAAIMKVMQARPDDGTFLIFDIGGGTTDISLAESTSGHVSLLSQGGIAMCGGRDIDRLITENIVYPWMKDNFKLPNDFWKKEPYKKKIKLMQFASESAKIELSTYKEESRIVASEADFNLSDEKGDDIYLDIPINRTIVDKLISEMINETIKAAKETLENAGLTTNDISRIVYIGGPIIYKPFQDKVAKMLGIPANTDVNPMTAVAEGAAIFAESIDWVSQSKATKNIRGSLHSLGAINLNFDYIARTPDTKTKIKVTSKDQLKGKYEIQIDSIDTGANSGKIALKDGITIDLLLSEKGENVFCVYLFDEYGETVPISPNKIVITRTAATIDSTPVSHSIVLAVLDKPGGTPTNELIVKKGVTLPTTGNGKVKPTTQLKSGDIGSINFLMYEGELENPLENRNIGVFKISGNDFADGIIHAGADINYTFEMSVDGHIRLYLDIPSIQSSFDSEKSFYSAQEGKKDYTDPDDIETIISDAEKISRKAEEIATKIDDPELNKVIEKIEEACSLDPNETDPEKTKEAEEKILQAKKDLSNIRNKHKTTIHQMELDHEIDYFENVLRKDATSNEKERFDKLVTNAKRYVGQSNFISYMDEINRLISSILWKQDWFIIDMFKYYASKPFLFENKTRFNALVKQGEAAILAGDIKQLNKIIGDLFSIMTRSGGSSAIYDQDVINIVKVK